MIIDTGTYIYREKDALIVKQELYRKVCVNESIHLNDIIEVLKMLREDHPKTDSPGQEQEINELMDNYIELLESIKES